MLKSIMARGFTIIETVMVIVIVAILSVVLFLKWSPFESTRLEGAARKVTGDIRYAQKLSVSTGSRTGLVFSANGYSVYQLINGPSPLLANSPGDPCSTDQNNKFVVDFTADRCVEFEGVTLSFLNNAIAFDSLGRLVNATTAGSIELPTQTVEVLYKGSKTLTVESYTGRVSY